MIGYVLLVTFAIVMAAGIYTWMKTYVPSDIYSCPEGTSIFIKDYTCTNESMTITLKNNGRFDLAGIFVHASNQSGSEIATYDLSSGLSEGGINLQNSIIFIAGSTNTMAPGDEKGIIIDLPSVFSGTPYLLEIIPVRFQEEKGKLRFVSCGDSQVAQDLNCVCVPNCESESRVCGSDGCGGTCLPGCAQGETCSGGQCYIQGAQ